MVSKREGGLSRQWFRTRRQVIAAGGAYDEVEYNPLLQNAFLQITRVGVLDEDHAPTKVRLYVKGHGYEHWEGEEASPLKDTLYWIEWPTYLVEGEQLVARFYGATLADNLEMILEGWLYDPPTILTNVVVTVIPDVV